MEADDEELRLRPLGARRWFSPATMAGNSNCSCSSKSFTTMGTQPLPSLSKPHLIPSCNTNPSPFHPFLEPCGGLRHVFIRVGGGEGAVADDGAEEPMRRMKADANGGHGWPPRRRYNGKPRHLQGQPSRCSPTFLLPGFLSFCSQIQSSPSSTLLLSPRSSTSIAAAARSVLLGMPEVVLPFATTSMCVHVVGVPRYMRRRPPTSLPLLELRSEMEWKNI